MLKKVPITLWSAFVLLCSLKCYAVLKEEATWTGADKARPIATPNTPPVDFLSEENLFLPSFPDEYVQRALDDPEQRIADSFHTPKSLRTTVEFWLKIYTKWSSHHIVLFDRNQPEIVYEVLDFHQHKKDYKNKPIQEEILRLRKVRERTRSYERALTALVKNPSPTKPTAEQQKILDLLKAQHIERPNFRELSKNVRSQTGQRDSIVTGLVSADSYFDKMEEIFEGYKIPIEVSRLCLVESSFNVKSISRAGAVGVWQFLRRSGKQFLVLNKKIEVDERRSPLKSTVAAAKLLNLNYRIFGNWPLAITAYHSGTGNLLKIPAKHRTGDQVAELFNGGSIKTSRLGYAGRNYYASFLAVLHAEFYRDLFYGDNNISAVEPVRFLKLGQRQSLREYSKRTGVALERLKNLNPDVRRLDIKLPKGFWILIPTEGEISSNEVDFKRWGKSFNRG